MAPKRKRKNAAPLPPAAAKQTASLLASFLGGLAGSLLANGMAKKMQPGLQPVPGHPGQLLVPETGEIIECVDTAEADLSDGTPGLLPTPLPPMPAFQFAGIASIGMGLATFPFNLGSSPYQPQPAAPPAQVAAPVKKKEPPKPPSPPAPRGSNLDFQEPSEPIIHVPQRRKLDLDE